MKNRSKKVASTIAVVTVAGLVLTYSTALFGPRPTAAVLQNSIGEVRLESTVVTKQPADDAAAVSIKNRPERLMSINIDDPEFQDAIKVEYRNSPDLPDGISFTLTLTSVSASFEDDPDSSTYILMENLGLSFRDAEEIRIELDTVNAELESEVRTVHAELLCLAGVPRVYGDEVFSAFETAEEIQDSIAEEKYLAFLSTLPSEYADRFRQWNDELKLSTTAVRFRYKPLLESKQIDPDVAAAQFCLHQS